MSASGVLQATKGRMIAELTIEIATLSVNT